MTQSIPSTPVWQHALSTSEQVNSCAISADGSRVVAGTSQEFGPGQFAVVCFDAAGNPLWRQPVGPGGAYQGVFWVAISADGSTVAAGGELAKGSNGFLVAFDGATGASLYSQTGLPGRVNQVSLSDDGSTLLACHLETIALYRRGSTLVFVQTDSCSVAPDCTIESAMLSGDGTRVVAGSIHYAQETTRGSAEAAGTPDGAVGSAVESGTGAAQDTTSGCIVSAQVSPLGRFENLATTTFDSGVMRVAITGDGSAWGGVLHDASCVCFLAGATSLPAWRHRADLATQVAYAFAITGSASGTVFLACGVNLPPVEDITNAPEGAVISLSCDAQAPVPVPAQRWVARTRYAVNPGVTFDRAATLVSATDGKPDPGNEKIESAGNFYLYDNVANRLLWSYPTSKMNWPMAIAANGNAVVGASDDGRVYYWAATDSPVTSGAATVPAGP